MSSIRFDGVFLSLVETDTEFAEALALSCDGTNEERWGLELVYSVHNCLLHKDDESQVRNKAYILLSCVF